jgi:DNA primase
MQQINWRREGAERFHRFLPEDVRDYLKGRGIPSTIIKRALLGWNGEQITIPLFGRERGEMLGFRYANVPGDPTAQPEMLSDRGAEPELYGWETLVKAPRRIVIAEGEFDRLALEAHGFPSVASTAGPCTFLKEWLPYFAPVKHIYVSFHRGVESEIAAKKLQKMLPSARIVMLPEGAETIADFFMALRRTRVDYEVALAMAETAEGRDDPYDVPPRAVREFRPYQKKLQHRAAVVKRAVPLHDVVALYTDLRAEGGRLLGHCPFHDEQTPSFAVYPKTNTYFCSVCEAQGDAMQFVMNKESITFRQALEALERFAITNEFHA